MRSDELHLTKEEPQSRAAGLSEPGQHAGRARAPTCTRARLTKKRWCFQTPERLANPFSSGRSDANLGRKLLVRVGGEAEGLPEPVWSEAGVQAGVQAGGGGRGVPPNTTGATCSGTGSFTPHSRALRACPRPRLWHSPPAHSGHGRDSPCSSRSLSCEMGRTTSSVADALNPRFTDKENDSQRS